MPSEGRTRSKRSDAETAARRNPTRRRAALRAAAARWPRTAPQVRAFQVAPPCCGPECRAPRSGSQAAIKVFHRRGFNAETQRGEAAAKLLSRSIQRRGRRGFRKGRKERTALRPSAQTFASFALRNLRSPRRCSEIAMQRPRRGAEANAGAPRNVSAEPPAPLCVSPRSPRLCVKVCQISPRRRRHRL